MLSTIRHFQKGLLIVITIVIVITMGYFGTNQSGSLSGDAIFSVYGHSYDDKDIRKLKSHFLVARDLGMSEFVRYMFGTERLDDDLVDYMINVEVLREEASRLGIQFGPDDIAAAVPELPVFQRDSGLSRDMMYQYVLGPRGFEATDLSQLMNDYLSFQKLMDLLHAGMDPLQSEVERRYAFQFQRMTASRIDFKREDFTEDVEVTAEEIQSYFTDPDNQDSLMTEEKRKIAYVFLAAPEDTEEMTQEQKATQRKEFNQKVNDLYVAVTDENADFSAVLEKQGYEVKETDYFTGDAPPAELQSEYFLLQSVFKQISTNTGAAEPIRGMAKQGFFVYSLEDVQPSAPMELEEARPKIIEVLKERAQEEKVRTAAADVRAKISEALEAGKTFEAAAKEAGQKVIAMKPFTPEQPPADVEGASRLAGNAARLAPGKVSEPVAMPYGATLIYMREKVLEESLEENIRKEMIRQRLSQNDRYRIFLSWFEQKRKESGAQRRPGYIVRATENR